MRMRERGLLPETAATGDIPEVEPLRMPEKENALDMSAYLPGFLARYLKRKLVSHPLVMAPRCIGCGVCARVCPPQSLKIEGGKPEFDLKNCIRCYCCQEHCPQGAIVVKRTLLMRIAGRMENLLRRAAGILHIRGRNGRKN